MKAKMDLMKLMQDFDTSDECRAYLEGLRWPKGVKCPRCKSLKVSRILKRNQFDCDSCRYQFSVTVGSIFHDSHLPLPKWFAAVYLMCEAKKGVSANQLKRTLGVSYKTAWYLCHRIRKAMEEARPKPLSGTVEVDETYIGGKRRHVGSGYRANKSIVLGAIERGGSVRLRVEKRNDRKACHRFIRKTTAPKTERIITDEWLPIAESRTRIRSMKPLTITAKIGFVATFTPIPSRTSGACSSARSLVPTIRSARSI